MSYTWSRLKNAVKRPCCLWKKPEYKKAGKYRITSTKEVSFTAQRRVSKVTLTFLLFIWLSLSEGNEIVSLLSRESIENVISCENVIRAWLGKGHLPASINASYYTGVTIRQSNIKWNFYSSNKIGKKLVINLTATLEKGCGGVVSEHEKFINFIFFFFRID